MTLASPPVRQHEPRRGILLGGISWSLYQHMLAEIRNGGVRLTYDQGWLEIMTLSPRHENVKKMIARLLEAYADERETRIEGLGSTTFAREELQRGLEPDECYYIAHAAEVIGKDKLDLDTDPPPDLAIDVDISSPDIAKLPIYAALRIPEVWRYDGSRLAPMRLRGGRYVEVRRSVAFPDLPMDRLNAFLEIGLASGQTAAVRALRAWLRGR
jgi:Uma2 family endonuclease